MTAENPRLSIQRRANVANSLELPPNFVENALTKAYPSIEDQQINIIRDNPDKMCAELDRLKDHVKSRGYHGEPSALRLSAEYLIGLGIGWHEFAVQAHESGDDLTYTFFEDMQSGASMFAAFIIAADEINNQGRNPYDSQIGAQVSQAMSELSTEAGTGSSADYYIQSSSIAQQVADMLGPNPSQDKIDHFAEYINMQIDTPQEQDPYPISNIPAFMHVGVKMAMAVMRELQFIQEDRRN